MVEYDANLEDEEEEEIDEEQVEDYCAMLDKLGNFPEKVAINSLSMAAEDFASSPTSATTIYDCIRSRLIDQTSPGISCPDRKLPLVYVLDSLLKNVKGVYISIIQDDAANWMSTVYDIFDKANKENEKARLKKVWNTWREQGAIKDQEKWRQIGQCFLKADEKEKAVADAKTTAAGIGRDADGTLQLTPSLRKQMQLLLDEVQSTGVDELDKVSLERLADINPDLLKQIKEAATEEHNQQQSSMQQPQQSSTLSSANTPAFPTPPLSDWSKLKLNHLEKSHDLIASLQRHVRSANETTVVKSELNDTIHLYASVSASAQLLTDMLQQLKDGKGLGFGEGNGNSSRRRRRYSLVKSENFTNEGIKKRNDAVIAQLYEVGLPFICSADGRRFATQLELSKHLDALFRKSQLEKTMEKTEERGWFAEESVWILGRGDTEATMATDDKSSDALQAAADTVPAEDVPTALTTVVADETRDRCILCGINFAMFFDQDDGEWKYKNCTEKNVEQDGPTMDEEEMEAVLVHATCWEGLGSPEYLTADQIRHAA
mmetsp:Transcript_31695/g.66650  ORF Transcript_31695/g.66650 Transcript_31695/m.66650 type:complete len:546 (-) Transcript_31695:423-2060(-)|eukprot:CAMPEP_0172316198 /NCGR_PEP_ID=MMETSP1058-20130122/27503_1 /TAXON_ID=83371 /ORGANISM="Detonula confervacea, Strain CCMP 353" /LENGTH=545 /DNA_ID=CAMNT_0013030455 /DNA_START=79 /DNA_END=1716 /DNA_ORIENTATION=-